MSSSAASPSAESTAESSNPSARATPSGLHAQAVEARERLRPERPAIPAPRSEAGVQVPPAFGSGPGAGAASAGLVSATDDLVSTLAAIDETPDEPAHRALARIGELTAAGVPDEEWSAREGFAPEVLAEAAEKAATLHGSAAALLERLDAEGHPSSAVAIDGLATSLRVVRMVADLEVFAVTRG